MAGLPAVTWSKEKSDMLAHSCDWHIGDCRATSARAAGLFMFKMDHHGRINVEQVMPYLIVLSLTPANTDLQYLGAQ